MGDFLFYLWESSICLAGFVLVYQLFLRRVGHFAWNRGYLLVVLLLSLALPALEWEVNPAATEWMPRLTTDAPVQPTPTGNVPIAPTFPSDVTVAEGLGPQVGALQKVPAPEAAHVPVMNWKLVLFLVWMAGAVLTLVRLVTRLAGLMKYRRLPADAGVVALPGGGGSFSFAGRIFLDDAGLSPIEKEMVLRHERAHLRLKHGWDNFLVEFAKILWWFHPLLPVLRRNLRDVHEYQADAVAGAENPLLYSRLVLKLASGHAAHRRSEGSQLPPATAFAASKAGQRIEMLHQKPESKMTKLKYLIFLPLLAVLSAAFVLVPTPTEPAAMPPAKVEAKLDFAGEPIPVEMPHVQTKLERELKRLVADASLREQLQKRAQVYGPKVTSILLEEGVPTDFFFLAITESHLRLNAKSPGGAVGLWQFLPGTARTFGLTVNGNVDQRTDAELATKAACRYLKQAHSELGSWTAAAVAFNRGVPGYRNFLANRKVSSYFESTDQREHYLYRVIAYKLLMLDKQVPSVNDLEVPSSNPPEAFPLEQAAEVEVSSGFGERLDPETELPKMHEGIDLRAPIGTAVLAPADGEVTEVGEDDVHGKHITLQHDAEYSTRYFHLSEISVEPGQAVQIGTQIGKVGTTGRSTGPHLHYEVRKNGEAVDPAGYFFLPQD